MIFTRKEKLVIGLLENENGLSNIEITELLGYIPKRAGNIYRLLKGLEDKKIIIKEKKRYFLIKDLPGNNDQSENLDLKTLIELQNIKIEELENKIKSLTLPNQVNSIEEKTSNDYETNNNKIQIFNSHRIGMKGKIISVLEKLNQDQYIKSIDILSELNIEDKNSSRLKIQRALKPLINEGIIITNNVPKKSKHIAYRLK